MQTKSLSEYWQIVARRKIFVFLTAACAALSAFVASTLIAPNYEAKVQFYVIENSDNGGFFSGGNLGYRAQSLLLPAFTEGTVMAYVGMLQTDAVRTRVTALAPAKAVADLRNDVDVSSVKKYLLNVRVLDRKPEVALSVANAYPNAFDQFLNDVAKHRRNESLEGMKTSHSQLVTQLREARSRLAAFLREQKTSSLQKEGDSLIDRGSKLKMQITENQVKLDGIEQRNTIAAEQLKKEVANSAVTAGIINPNIQRLMKELSDLNVELAATRAEFDGLQASKHPKRRMLEARIEEKKIILDNEISKLKSSETSSADTLQEQLRREVAGQLKDRVATRTELLTQTVELKKMQKQIGDQQTPRLIEAQMTAELLRLEKMLDSLSLRMNETQTLNSARTSSVVVLNKAELPKSAKFPSLVLNTLIAGLLGLIGGVYLVFFLDFLQRASLDTPSEDAIG